MMMMNMGSFGLMHLFAVVIIFLIVGIPVARILRRIGFSGWWSILAIIPLANLIALWVLAFVDWPARSTLGTPATA